MTFGDGRRKTLDTLQKKNRLDPIENPETLDDLKEAVTDLAVSPVFSPDKAILERMDAVYANLPEEAQREYVQDRVLVRRINALRRQFNEWKGRKIREQKMPGPMEAGPANYPTKKLRKRQRSERNAYEELQEKMDRAKAGANGARQRALQAIGSNVAEQNEQRREAKREERRDSYEPGDVVVFRNPDLQVGRVVRLNTKSVRVEYPNRFYKPDADHESTRVNTEDLWQRNTIQLDSDFLTKTDAETVKEELERRGEMRGYDATHPAVADEQEQQDGGDA